MLQYLFFLSFLYITKINNTEKYIWICFSTVSIFKTKEITIHHDQNVKSENAKLRKTYSLFFILFFYISFNSKYSRYTNSDFICWTFNYFLFLSIFFIKFCIPHQQFYLQGYPYRPWKTLYNTGYNNKRSELLE